MAVLASCPLTVVVVYLQGSDGGRYALIAGVEIGNAHAQDGVVEQVERIGVVVAFGVGHFVDRANCVFFLVVALFDIVTRFAAFNHAGVLFLRENGHRFAQLEIGDETFGGRGDLDVFPFIVTHKKHSFTEGALYVTICLEMFTRITLR